MSAVETRQMYSIGKGQSPVSREDICLVSTADICPVSTEDTCPVKTDDIWLLWGHLGTDENDFDHFFTPKMRKMEHRPWNRWSRRSHGNDATGRAADLRSTRARSQDYVIS